MSDEVKNRFERIIQLIFGCCLWAYMLYVDLAAGTDVAELSTQTLIIKGCLYGFAAVLIKGVTTAEITELIRAWRGHK